MYVCALSRVLEYCTLVLKKKSFLGCSTSRAQRLTENWSIIHKILPWARSTHSYPLSAAADTGKPASLKAQARELQTPTASLRHSCSLACPGAAAGRGGEAPAEIRRPQLFRNVARSANFKIACMFCARARACSAYGSSQAGLSWSLNISVARQHTGTATGGMPPAYSATGCVHTVRGLLQLQS